MTALAQPAGSQGPGPMPGALLRALDLALVRRAGGVMPGDHLSPGAGAGTELVQLRPYQVGDDVADVNFRCQTSRSLVIWGDQLIRKGPLRPLKHLLLHSPLVVWAPFASNVYHDVLWYPTVGQSRIRAFANTGWGRLFARY